MVNEALRLMRERDVFAGVEFLCEQGDAGAVMDAFGRAVLDLYWKEKDLAGAVAMGWVGMQYGLTVRSDDVEVARKLRGAVRAIAYNVGSFCWPGWDEPGIVTGPVTVALGLEAARVSRRLVVELGDGDVALSRAAWLIGAHELARGAHAEALARFNEAAGLAARGGKSGEALLNETYARLVEACAVPGGAERGDALERSLAALASAEDGAEFVAQVRTAAKVFGC